MHGQCVPRSHICRLCLEPVRQDAGGDWEHVDQSIDTEHDAKVVA